MLFSLWMSAPRAGAFLNLVTAQSPSLQQDMMCRRCSERPKPCLILQALLLGAWIALVGTLVTLPAQTVPASLWKSALPYTNLGFWWDWPSSSRTTAPASQAESCSGIFYQQLGKKQVRVEAMVQPWEPWEDARSQELVFTNSDMASRLTKSLLGLKGLELGSWWAEAKSLNWYIPLSILFGLALK